MNFNNMHNVRQYKIELPQMHPYRHRGFEEFLASG